MGPIRKAGLSLSASSGTHSGWPVPHCHPRPFPVLPATPAAEGTVTKFLVGVEPGADGSRVPVVVTTAAPGHLWSASLWH